VIEMNKQQVLDKIGEENWELFCEFMTGQTVEVGKDGKTNYFKCDVENFIHKLNTGKLLFFD